ncbi:hypothetical protein [Nonomuraea bangladeshensis]|uniref:hypothetical protein n=1 Tax=Nonomuraea bangladeshensis TaxID=404385 RepID=UPI0031D9C35A
MPEGVAGFLTHLFTTVLDGRDASLGDGIQRTLGREPRAFADFARQGAARGIWSAVRRSRSVRAVGGDAAWSPWRRTCRSTTRSPRVR